MKLKEKAVGIVLGGKLTAKASRMSHSRETQCLSGFPRLYSAPTPNSRWNDAGYDESLVDDETERSPLR